MHISLTPYKQPHPRSLLYRHNSDNPRWLQARFKTPIGYCTVSEIIDGPVTLGQLQYIRRTAHQSMRDYGIEA